MGEAILSNTIGEIVVVEHEDRLFVYLFYTVVFQHPARKVRNMLLHPKRESGGRTEHPLWHLRPQSRRQPVESWRR